MLIVEDGTGLADADSYVSLDDARVYAQSLGLSLPALDDDADIALRNGAIYVDSFESSFSGARLNDTQALAWPRSGAYKCYGRNQSLITSDEVPKQIKDAQVLAAVEYGSGTNVMPVDDGLSIASSEVVGAVKESYFDNGKTGGTIKIIQAINAMKPLLCAGSNPLSLRTLRV